MSYVGNWNFATNDDATAATVQDELSLPSGCEAIRWWSCAEAKSQNDRPHLLIYMSGDQTAACIATGNVYPGDMMIDTVAGQMYVAAGANKDEAATSATSQT